MQAKTCALFPQSLAVSGQTSAQMSSYTGDRVDLCQSYKWTLGIQAAGVWAYALAAAWLTFQSRHVSSPSRVYTSLSAASLSWQTKSCWQPRSICVFYECFSAWQSFFTGNEWLEQACAVYLQSTNNSGLIRLLHPDLLLEQFVEHLLPTSTFAMLNQVLQRSILRFSCQLFPSGEEALAEVEPLRVGPHFVRNVFALSVRPALRTGNAVQEPTTGEVKVA